MKSGTVCQRPASVGLPLSQPASLHRMEPLRFHWPLAHDVAAWPLRRAARQDLMLRCLIDIAAGMEYLHSLGVIHGDLKGANVLLKSTGYYPGFVCKVRCALLCCAAPCCAVLGRSARGARLRCAATLPVAPRRRPGREERRCGGLRCL